MSPPRYAAAHPATRLADRLFLAGCTGAYLILIGSVAAALKFYVG